MTRKTRFIILSVCIFLFLAISPVIVFYSMGYRYDIKKMKVVSTGGIYVRTFPAADAITIDGNIVEQPGLFQNSIFVQNLLPDQHTVAIEKAGYRSYFKTLPVQEKEVTKLENVTLFQEDIDFTLLDAEAPSPFPQDNERYLIKANTLYYSAIKANELLDKKTPLIKNIIAFDASATNIVWLGSDGVVYQSDSAGKNSLPLTETRLTIAKSGAYQVTADGQYVFVNDQGNLLQLNRDTKTLDPLLKKAKDVAVSPDGKQLAYVSETSLYLWVFEEQDEEKKNNLLYKGTVAIKNLQWLNNYYLLFSAGNAITISEVDYRGEVNKFELPKNIEILAGEPVAIIAPQAIFSRPENRLYILTGESILKSEQILN